MISEHLRDSLTNLSVTVSRPNADAPH